MSIFPNPARILPWGVYNTISPVPTNTYPFSTSIKGGIYLIDWVQSFSANPNNAANYWTFNLVGAGLSPTFGTVFSMNTSGVTIADGFSYRMEALVNLFLADPPYNSLYINCVSTGAPGALFLLGPRMRYTGNEV